MRLPRDAALGGRSSECSDQGEQLAFSDRIALLDLHPSLAAVAPACAATGHIGSFNYGWDGTQTGAGSLTGNDNPIWPHRDGQIWPHPMVVINAPWRLLSSPG